LNGRADFRNQNSNPDRWAKLGVELQPWRRTGRDKFILLCGQVPWDASVEHIHMDQWLVESYRAIKSHTDRRVYVRPHPKAPKHLRINGAEEHAGPINWDDVHAVVTFNSNIAVEAVVAGVPAFVDDIGSMALQVGNRSIANIESPWYPQRTRWAQELAYTQWTPQEIRNGEAWAHLSR